VNVTLSPRTQRLLQERLKEGEYASTDDLIRIALESLEGEPFEELDAETQAAIERAEVQGDRGEGIPAAEAVERLRHKRFCD
jgi:Arc/MetJ-type ribon-helix-helix transcriptional regulator